MIALPDAGDSRFAVGEVKSLVKAGKEFGNVRSRHKTTFFVAEVGEQGPMPGTGTGRAARFIFRGPVQKRGKLLI